MRGDAPRVPPPDWPMGGEEMAVGGGPAPPPDTRRGAREEEETTSACVRPNGEDGRSQKTEAKSEFRQVRVSGGGGRSDGGGGGRSDGGGAALPAGAPPGRHARPSGIPAGEDGIGTSRRGFPNARSRPSRNDPRRPIASAANDGATPRPPGRCRPPAARAEAGFSGSGGEDQPPSSSVL